MCLPYVNTFRTTSPHITERMEHMENVGLYTNETREGRSGDGAERAVRTLRARQPAALTVSIIVASVVAAVAVAEIITTLAGSPLHNRVWDCAASHGHDGAHAGPEMLIATSVLMALGLSVLVIALLPARGDWLALRTDGRRPADGVSVRPRNGEYGNPGAGRAPGDTGTAPGPRGLRER